ncbi:MAG: hypothetical protein ABIJ20_01010 [Nanoarchaeota archaeon]|nr:hypothetical protein [Nanoarchaeota archaeon]MBU1444735.1 hypothetical protein [Nanoarchaeota archaeon]MBU2406819.1 hypothetical protein [Nanoarchaeota archaeon]MBU2420769.1 hypothetical protein [Nanoarchaeota archaeon]MBU2475831.1 hypothetical protein [Nanoarchaeota archaeon]
MVYTISNELNNALAGAGKNFDVQTEFDTGKYVRGDTSLQATEFGSDTGASVQESGTPEYLANTSTLMNSQIAPVVHSEVTQADWNDYITSIFEPIDDGYKMAAADRIALLTDTSQYAAAGPLNSDITRSYIGLVHGQTALGYMAGRPLTDNDKDTIGKFFQVQSQSGQGPTVDPRVSDVLNHYGGIDRPIVKELLGMKGRGMEAQRRIILNDVAQRSEVLEKLVTTDVTESRERLLRLTAMAEANSAYQAAPRP